MSVEQAEKEIEQKPETKRGRIRRMLFDPLERDGFRKSAKIAEQRHKDSMARLADDLAYLSDDAIEGLRLMLRTKGEGKSRDIWPSTSTILGFAELIEARPLSELPRLLSWFASIEGPRAMREGLLVESYLFFRARKKPPVQADGRYPLMLREQAREYQSRLAGGRERIAKGRASQDDRDFVTWYEQKLAYCEGLVTDSGGGDSR